MKTCCDCLEPKPSSEFYKMANGNPAGVCIVCHKARMKRRRLSNPTVQAFDRARAKTPERRAMATRVTTQWRKNNPEAYKAQNAVNNAVRDGRLTKGPCSICGTGVHVHGHHKDYSKQLDVTWLCAKCHQRIHATFPELGGNYWNREVAA